MTPAELRQAFAALGITQAEGARVLGVDVATIERWATGRSRVPGPAALALRLLVERGLTGLAARPET